MPGALPKFETGPKTYEASVNIKAGLVVEYVAGTPTQPGLSLVQLSTLTSLKVAGVATKDSISAANQAALLAFTSGDGFPSLNASVPSEAVAIAKRGEFTLTYFNAVAYGDKVKAAAAGQVALWVRGTDSVEAIIGSCQEQGGVSAAGTGKTWINVL